MDVYSIFDTYKSKKKRYEKYAEILSSRHSRLKHLISLIGPIKIEVPIWSMPEDAVLYAVIGQMLSVSAASSIIKRLIERFDSSRNVIDWAGRTYLRKGPVYGVSQRKRKALREWNKYFTGSSCSYKGWKKMAVSEYRNEVKRIWGFGEWSADMIGIFHLGRMDILPVQDSGIKKMCRVLFGNEDVEGVRHYFEDCETVASIYMWEALNRNLLGSLQ